MVRSAGCACLLVQGVFPIVQFSSKSFKKSCFNSIRPPDRVRCQFVQFSSGQRAKCLRSVRSVHSVEFTNSSDPAVGGYV